jgi:hypothetical protein
MKVLLKRMIVSFRRLEIQYLLLIQVAAPVD